jgi:REP element-mobilizing transposase RayT
VLIRDRPLFLDLEVGFVKMDGMRIARRFLIQHEQEQVFHVMSRVVDRQLMFDEEEKSVFQRIMRQVETFSGCTVMTYCVMGNHFHILLRIPSRPEHISEAELFRRLEAAYPRPRVEAWRQQLAAWRSEGHEERINEFKGNMESRMHDLSSFMKMLKQRFTQFFNRRHCRKGTLWEERFKSLLVGREGYSIAGVAIYIERNPQRAGLADGPGHYPWTCLSEAKTGSTAATRGLQSILSPYLGPADRAQLLAYMESLVAMQAGSGNQTEKARKSVEAFQGQPISNRDSPTDTLEGSRGRPNDRTIEDLMKMAGSRFAEKCLVLSRGIVMGTADFVEKCRARIVGVSSRPGSHWNSDSGKTPDHHEIHFLRRLRILDSD